jgi:hypothetical protein
VQRDERCQLERFTQLDHPDLSRRDLREQQIAALERPPKHRPRVACDGTTNAGNRRVSEADMSNTVTSRQSAAPQS